MKSPVLSRAEYMVQPMATLAETKLPLVQKPIHWDQPLRWLLIGGAIVTASLNRSRHPR